MAVDPSSLRCAGSVAGLGVVRPGFQDRDQDGDSRGYEERGIAQDIEDRASVADSSVTAMMIARTRASAFAITAGRTSRACRDESLAAVCLVALDIALERWQRDEGESHCPP